MSSYPYDRIFQPPAPAVDLLLGSPRAVPDHPVRALLDSGADLTVIPEAMARDLSLVRVDVVAVFGVGQEALRSNIYVLSVLVPEMPVINLRVLSWSRPYALIGRDVLNRVRIVLDGPQLQLTLEGAVP